MKRTPFLIFLSVLLAAGLFPVPAFAATDSFAPNVDITAKAVYLYNIDTGKVIYEKEADTPMPPASMTKVMTAILAMENTENLDKEIVAYPRAVEDELYTYQLEHGRISLGGLRAGDEFTMRDCLYALMLPSANEVALNIAVHVDGSQKAFVERMNRRAKELGATNTNFVNPNGLYDSNHMTTARDMAKIAEHAMKLPGFMEIANTINYTGMPLSQREALPWVSTNKLITENSSYYYEYASGIKTGFVPESGFCLVSTASKDGFTYLLVVMGCGEYNADGSINREREMSFVDSKNIYEWAFKTYRIKTLISAGDAVGEAELRLSFDKDHVKLMAGERFTSLLPENISAENVTYVLYTDEYFNAPVKKNDVVGEVALMLSGEEVGRVPLLIAESVEAAPALVLLEQVKAVTRSFWFKFGVIMFVLLIVLYIILMILRNRRRRKSGYRPRRRM